MKYLKHNLPFHMLISFLSFFPKLDSTSSDWSREVLFYFCWLVFVCFEVLKTACPFDGLPFLFSSHSSLERFTSMVTKRDSKFYIFCSLSQSSLDNSHCSPLDLSVSDKPFKMKSISFIFFSLESFAVLSIGGVVVAV